MSPSPATKNLPASRWPHRVAVAICCCAFPLVWVGGLVTTYDAGMAVPDWPSTFGYNLFLYPWTTWLFGPFDLFIEHGHRLLGATVGLLSILFVAVVYRTDRGRGLRSASLVMLGLVVSQGVLGGMRVLLDERVLALLHACLGIGTFAYAAALAVVTSRYRTLPREVQESDSLRRKGRRLLRLSVLTAALVYVQVILGALLRHVPVAATPGFFRVAVLFHVAVAIAVSVHVLLLTVRGWKLAGQVPGMKGPLVILNALMLLQLSLGAGTWVVKFGWPDWFADQAFAAAYTVQANSLLQAMVTTLHVAVGALIMAWTVVLAARARIFFRVTSQLESRRRMGSEEVNPVAVGRRAGWVV